MKVNAYLEITMKIDEANRPLFRNDVFVSLKPLWSADPDVKIYAAA